MHTHVRIGQGWRSVHNTKFVGCDELMFHTGKWSSREENFCHCL